MIILFYRFKLCYNESMQIKKKTQYTINILIHLAVHNQNSDELLDIKNVSAELDIAYEHSRKIVQELAKLEIIQSVRGRNGGIRLAKAPTEIHIYQLILEFEAVRLEAFEHSNDKFEQLLNRQYQAFYQAFDGIYLSDLM